MRVTTADGKPAELYLSEVTVARPTKEGGVIELQSGAYLLVDAAEYLRVIDAIGSARKAANQRREGKR